MEEPVYVYNIEVENAHTYFVGEDEILVHNKAEKLLHFGEYSVSNTEFHGPGGIKENILSQAGNYGKRVGNNPDIKVLQDGSITLQGTGPFKGKSMKTDLNFKNFLPNE